MCTYRTEKIDVAASSGKGPQGWFPLRAATVYYDHPVHALHDHTVNIDFLNPELGPGARVAVELGLADARSPRCRRRWRAPPTTERLLLGLIIRGCGGRARFRPDDQPGPRVVIVRAQSSQDRRDSTRMINPTPGKLIVRK